MSTTRFSLAALTLMVSVVASSTAWAQFAAEPDLPEGRSQALALVDGEGKVHLFGGYTNATSSNATDDHRVYDPGTEQWSTGTAMPEPRRAACGATLSDGRMVIVGGYGSGQIASASLYDPASDTYTALPDSPTVHGWYCAATKGADGRVYVIGGEGGDRALSIFDPGTGTWSSGASSPSEFRAHGVSLMRDGRIYAFGGSSNNGDDLFIYDPNADTWTAGPSMPAERSQFAWASAYGRLIYVIGGSTSNGNFSSPFFDTVFVYDLATGQWSTSTDTDLVTRREATAVQLGTGIHVLGGNGGTSQHRVSHARVGVTANVAILAADNSNGVDTALAARGADWNVTVLPAYTGQETLATIRDFDAVLSWTNFTNSNGVHFGNLLADYVDSGGGVITMTFANYANDFDLEGRWRGEGYACEATTETPYSSGTVDQTSILLPNHPIIRGVGSMSVSNYRTGAEMANEDCARVANFTDGQLFAAANSTKAGRLAWLGFYPGGANASNLDVLHQTLEWVVGGSGGNSQVPNAPPTVSLDPTFEATEGQPLTLVATGADSDMGPGELVYDWDLDGDGEFDDASGPSVEFIGPDGPATVVVSVRVSDGADTAQASTTVTVLNAPPTVQAQGDTEGFVGQTLTFSAVGTDPAGPADTLSYAWTFDDNGEAATGSEVTRVFTRAGTYNVTVTVTDEDGASTTATVVVEVMGLDPMITDLNIPADGDEGQVLGFSAAASSLRPLTYRWDFGDGSDVVEGQEVNHAFADDGTYFVQLTVVDDEGRTSTQVESVTVLNAAPVLVELDGDFQGNEGDTLAFEAVARDPAGENDTLTWTWIFGDGTPSASGVGLNEVSHLYAGNGTFTLTVIISDEDGGTTIAERTVNIGGQGPSIDTFAGDEQGVEAQPVSLMASASDPGNDPITYTWDFGDGSPAVTGRDRGAVQHTYADDGTYTVTLTVADIDGTASATREVTISNADPVIDEVEGPRTGQEGQGLTWSVRASDPAGQRDPLSYQWSFGDGESATGTTVSHAFADNGQYMVTVTVSDDDGGQTSQVITVVVDNAAPVLSELSAPAGGPEGQALRFEGVADDAGDDTLTWSWSFGDDSPAQTGVDLSQVEHTWSDDGTYTLTLTVVDEDGGELTVERQVQIQNVAPRVVSSPELVALVGQRYSYALEVEEPGDDALTFTLLEGPDGMAVDEEGVVSWGVGADLLGQGPFTASVRVCDDDGACDEQTWQISTSFEDVDQDGVPDDCERTYDLDPSDPGDAELDNDLDGINNRDECLNGGDPTVYNGPTAPSLSRPEVGARVADRTPELAVVNATDPDGDALVYTFEVYADAALTQLVAVSPSVTQGEAVTAWEVPFPLTEDATFWWRAQAADDFVGSAWSDTGSFFVDEVNSAPEVPVQVSPMGAVDTTTPALVVDMALDPEGDAVTYLFEVYADEALTELVASGADTETTWTVDAELGEDSTYWWRVAAQDDFEPVAQSDWSDPWSFVVNTANGLPEAPAILSPEEGQVFIDQAEVTLRWSQSSDPEGDALTYDVDLATDVDFIQIVLSEVGVEAGDEQEVELLLEGLELGSSYWARVRAQDGQGAGDFAQVSFSVESSNVAPTAPALLSPAQGDRVQIGDVDFTFSLSTDADGDALTYQVHVYADEAQAEPVASSPLLEELEGPEATQTLTVDVEPGTYYWTVVATDPSGLQAVGGPVAFDMVVTTNEAPGAPTPVSPVGGASVLPGEVVLVVENAVDPDEGDTLEYTFALFSDEALTTQVGEAITQPEGAQGQTSATVADLPEGSYYWIASATDDQGAQGPTSAVSNFVVEAETGGNNGVNNDTNNGGNNDVNNGGNNGGNNDQIPDVDGSVSGGGGGCDCSVPSSPARTPSWPVALLATLLGAFWLRRR